MRTQFTKTPILKAVLFLALASFILTGCGGVALNNWPGLTSGNGVVYSAQMQLKKVDASNGSQTWVYPDKVDAKNIFFAPPALVDGGVIAANYDNVVYKLDDASRNEIWSFKDVQGKGRFIAGPVLAKDLVLIPSSDHHLYALNQASGKLVWKFQARGALWAAVAVDDKLAYLAGMDHYLYAISLRNGQKVWEINLQGPMLHAPVLGPDGMLYLSTLAEEVIAVNTAQQSVTWRVPVEGKIWSPPLLHEGQLYMGTDLGTAKGKVYALNAKTGATVWSDDVTNAVIAAPVVFGDAVAFTSEGGEVFTKSFDGTDGWTRTIKGKLNSTPVVIDNRLVVAGLELEHLLVTFDAQGKQDWTYDAPKN